ncbi:MAG: FliG C-terminal domain-containing protein [bacterium]
MEISDLTPRQKTAIILTSLPQEVANSILMGFSPEERRAINAEFPRVRDIPENIKQQVLNEFLQKNKQTISSVQKQEQPKEEQVSISQSLDKLLGKPTVSSQPSGHSPVAPTFSSTIKSSKPLDFIAAINPKKVYWVLRNESSATIAFVLSQLAPAVSQRILSVFPTSQQTEINKHLVGIRKVDNRVIEAISKFIKQEIEEIDIPMVGETISVPPSSMPTVPTSTSPPTPVSAPTTPTPTAPPITQTTPPISPQTVTTASIIISNKKMDFTDISLLKPADMEHLLKLTNKNDWVIALKGLPPEIVDKILSIMPQVQAKVIKKEIETTPASKEDIIKAQRDILFKIKGLVTIGKVKIA